jgi:hypothetical protein
MSSGSKDKKGENVKVVVRCRPLNSVERERNDDSIVVMDTKLGSSQTHTHDTNDRMAHSDGGTCKRIAWRSRSLLIVARASSDLPPPRRLQFACRSRIVRMSSRRSHSIPCTRQAQNRNSYSTTVRNRSSTPYSTVTMERSSAMGQRTSEEHARSWCHVRCHLLISFNQPVASQTGTGKTFTMEGMVDDEKLRGMVPQAFYYVFAGVETHGQNMEFLVRGSFLEIYKDDVYDLLNSKMRSRMEVKESPDKGVFVKGTSDWGHKARTRLSLIERILTLLACSSLICSVAQISPRSL